MSLSRKPAQPYTFLAPSVQFKRANQGIDFNLPAEDEEDFETEIKTVFFQLTGEQAWIARRMWISETLLLRVVEVNERIRGGIPLLRGTRMTVAQLIGELADGRSLPDIAENFEIDAGDFRSLLEGIAVQFDRPFK